MIFPDGLIWVPPHFVRTERKFLGIFPYTSCELVSGRFVEPGDHGYEEAKRRVVQMEHEAKVEKERQKLRKIRELEELAREGDLIAYDEWKKLSGR